MRGRKRGARGAVKATRAEKQSPIRLNPSEIGGFAFLDRTG
ncbi:hypothetical protein HMPREF0185_02826 [Brevundimonas diminuta 470-4]|nr:hypothetical protein HMPREF0185_02826 [Brevundimonas diminuta 470-4]